LAIIDLLVYLIYLFDIFLCVGGGEKGQMHPGEQHVVQPKMQLKLSQRLLILPQ
jgi:hypothetical protein